MAKSADLIFNIIGRDKASGAFHSAGRAASKLDNDVKKTHKSFLGLSSVGKAVGAGLAGMGLAAAGREAMQFAKESVEAFKTVGSESMKMQRLLGGSIEEASLLRGVAKLSGQDIDAFAKSMGLFSKQIVNNGDAFADLGISVTDANGAIRPTQDLLKQTADVFAAMPAGAEETALAMKLFGKSGADLLPFLNKGSAGIAELEAKTRDLGMTMSQADADGLKKFTAATREMDLAVEGSKATLGKSLMPVMTELKTAAAAIAIPLTQAVTPAFVALGDVAVLAVQSIGQNMPAVKAAVADLASGIRGAADAVQDNWPAIKDTIGTVSDALKRVTDVTKTLWDAFRALPPEVQSTLATLAVLQKTGVISVAFSGANFLKDMFLKTPAVAIQAGSATVTGATSGVPGAAGSTATGKAAAGSSAMTLAGVNVPAVVAAVMAAGTIFAIHQMVTGGAARKVDEQGGNPATLGGSWQAMGAGGTNSGGGNQFGIEKIKEYRAAVDLTAIAQTRLNSAQAAGVVTAGQYGTWSESFGTSLMSTANAVKMSGDELKAMGAAVAAIPPGSSISEVEAVVARFGKSAGMTEEEIAAMSAAIVGIPGGSTMEQLLPGLQTAASAAGATEGEIRLMSASIAGIPGGASVESLSAAIGRAGTDTDMTRVQIRQMSDAIATIPPGSNAEVVAASIAQAGAAAQLTEPQIKAISDAVMGIPPGTSADQVAASISSMGVAAGLSQVEIDAMIASVLGIPPAAATSVSAPGATESTVAIDGVTAAANGVPPEASTAVTAPGAIQAAGEVGGVVDATSLIPPAASTTLSAPGAVQSAGEITGHTAAALGVPSAASTGVFAPGAVQSAREIAEHTNQAGLVPYSRSTSVSAPGALQSAGDIAGHTAAAGAVPGAKSTFVSAPGASGSAGQLRDVRAAADQVNGTRTIGVVANTSSAYSQLNSLLSWARSQTVTILSRIIPGGATGMAVPAFASGGGTPMMVSNGEFYASPQTVARTGGTGVWHTLNTGMITGPGSSTSDSIQAVGEPGGFVLNARATRRYHPVLRHLAGGGPTGAVATMTAPTTTERVALYIDGRMIHESLIRLKRERGGADLGLS